MEAANTNIPIKAHLTSPPVSGPLPLKVTNSKLKKYIYLSLYALVTTIRSEAR